MKLRLATVSVLLFASGALGADCQGNITQDPTFRDWCGASLCSWRTDYGQIAQAPTWSRQDLGVSFLDGDGTAGTEISQVTQEDSAACILFTSVGDIDPGAQMEISADFDNDGSRDFVAPLGATAWQKVETEITVPPVYSGITFYLTKRGTGTAILAEMRITATTGCTAPPVTLTGLRLGEGCSGDAACQAPLVCSGVNDVGVRLCSECLAAKDCPSGETCEQTGPFLPFQCSPHTRRGVTGAPCVLSGDCQSGICEGAVDRGALTDGGTCDPAEDTSSACVLVSALGGACL